MTVNVKSIEELRAAVSASDGTPLEIRVASGKYFIDETIRIENKSNISIIGEDGTRFIGGREVTGAAKVTDTGILERLDPSVRGKVYELQLPSEDIEIRNDYVTGLEIDGVNMQVAQYPKRGTYLKISGCVNSVMPTVDDGWGKVNCLLEEGTFFTDKSGRTAEWKNTDDMWVFGFWVYDWMYDRFPVKNFDAENGFFLAQGNGYHSGLENIRKDLFRIGQRIFFYNILEEVNTPASYFVDTKANKVYFMPPEGSDINEIILSSFKGNTFEVVDSKGIRFENLSFEANRGRAIKALNCEDIVMNLCLIRNMKHNAADFRDCLRARITGNAVYDVDSCGIAYSGGDRNKLISADTVISGNHIYRTGRFSLCNSGGLNIDGRGITVRNNLIHDLPHSAIFYSGNEILMEHNELYNLVQDTGDAGAIYAGRDYTARGNVIRENYIHHVGGEGSIGGMGIYNDDCLSGTTMERNILVGVGRACMLGGGRSLTVRNNIFIGCHPAIEMDSRGEPDLKIWRGIMRDLKGGVDERLFGNPKFVETYPETQEIIDLFNAEEGLPHIAGQAVIENNIFCDCDDYRLNMGGISADLVMRGNLDVEYDDIPGWGKGDFKLKDGNLAFRRGFRDVDASVMGICGAPCRSEAADVYSWFTADEKYLNFHVVNKGDSDVEVKYEFSSDYEDCDMSAYKVKFRIEAGRERLVSLDMINDHFEYVENGQYNLRLVNNVNKVTARSSQPGVRSAEIYNKKVIKQLAD